ncbi:MAG TPA: hypothetical protein PLH97_05935, partial [Verrucomicrobiota bacterium]|nr:hypothetical protein [Verrucomicrobiota bacterium]
MRRPLVIVAFLYGCGLLLADFITAPVPVLFTCALASVALALLIPRWRTPLLCSLLVLAGWTNLTWRTVPLSPHDLRAILSEPEDVILR